ncbi:MAG: HYExAFE family protein, partial [Planctomycetota bacterium]
MAQRRFHYERAFEHYLRRSRIPYVAVDEAKKALVGEKTAPELADLMEQRPEALKSFDFVVYGSNSNLLVELKGRKIRLRGSSSSTSSSKSSTKVSASRPGRRPASSGRSSSASKSKPTESRHHRVEASAGDSPARRAHAEAVSRAAASPVPPAAAAGGICPDDPYQQAFGFYEPPQIKSGGTVDPSDDADRAPRSRVDDRRSTSRSLSLNPALAAPPPLKPPKTGRLESWATRGDVHSLLAWERLFGSDFRAVFVFVYWCEAQPPDTLFQDVFPFEDRWYSMRCIGVDAYERTMVLRSPRWNTVHVPPAIYERMSEPFTRAYSQGLTPAGSAVRMGGRRGRSAGPREDLLG